MLLIGDRTIYIYIWLSSSSQRKFVPMMGNAFICITSVNLLFVLVPFYCLIFLAYQMMARFAEMKFDMNIAMFLHTVVRFINSVFLWNVLLLNSFTCFHHQQVMLFVNEVYVSCFHGTDVGGSPYLIQKKVQAKACGINIIWFLPKRFMWKTIL